MNAKGVPEHVWRASFGRRGRSALWALVSATFWGLAPAHAAAPSTVVIEVADCASSPEEPSGLLDALTVELAPLRLRPVWGSSHPPEVVARVLLQNQDCQRSSAPLELRIWSGHSQLIAERTVATRAVSRPVLRRTLALLVSEALGPTVEAAHESGSGADGDPATAPLDTPDPSNNRRLDVTPDDSLFTKTDPYPRPSHFHLGAAAEMRLAPPYGGLLIGLQLNAHGRLNRAVDWATEISYTAAGTWTTAGNEQLSIAWWSTSSGLDFLATHDGAVAFGPRLSAGYVTARTKDPSYAFVEHALLGELGVRARLSARLGTAAAIELLASFSHTLGVRDLTEDAGLVQPLGGWLLDWGMGIAFNP